MAFQLPTLPSFQTNIPQMPDPLQTYGRMLQLKALQGQQQMLPLQLQEQQQKVQAETLENQKRQLDLESQQKLMKAVAEGVFSKYAGVNTPDGSGFDAAGAYKEGAQLQIQPEMLSTYLGSILKNGQTQAEIRKTTGQAGEAEQNIREKTLKSLASKLATIGDMKADDSVKALDAFRQDLVNNPKAFAGLSQQELGELYGIQPGHLESVEGHFGLLEKVADFHKSQSEAAIAKQKELPEGGGLSPEMAAQAKKEVAVAKAEQPLKIETARAEGEARANIEARVARGSNAALAQVPPHLIPAASAAATKAGEDYALAQSVTQRLNATMDAARKGNVISYQVIPEEGTLQITTSQGVHRINQAEIQQYAGGGSLWQRMQGHFGKALTGESIPKSVLDDMAEIQKIQSEGSQLKYNNSIKTINETYGADFKPVKMEEIQSVRPGGGGLQVGQTVSVRGKQMKVTAVHPDGSFDAQ